MKIMKKKTKLISKQTTLERKVQEYGYRKNRKRKEG